MGLEKSGLSWAGVISGSVSIDTKAHRPTITENRARERSCESKCDKVVGRIRQRESGIHPGCHNSPKSHSQRQPYICRLMKGVFVEGDMVRLEPTPLRVWQGRRPKVSASKTDLVRGNS
jgi:hypothetical protein